MYEQQPGAGQPGTYPPAGPPQGGGAGGAIAVTLKYHPIGFLLGLFKPPVHLNGHEVATGWGRHVIPVQPGQHHLHIHVPYLLPSRIGNADLAVPVQPGQTVELEYRAPMVAFMNGALGAPPQKYPGMAVTIVLLVIALIILLCVCGGFIAAATSGSGSSSMGLPTLDAARTVATGLLC
ncbi:hypothetical protein EV385_6432 [Krasilnikovia cinnamomea]|uniref:Uncharacterized protein n=1 Tax=Krasilnikovia cinnamomea TaxID=349313 RepID=A0A4Q7ZUA2_9ACTN|nr:hypothetical protein [Krasilnikovia cinnamomea]RZU54481.1 hypothetical protein EV385_6432 [Krasilnikovia cinnamomea]